LVDDPGTKLEKQAMPNTTPQRTSQDHRRLTVALGDIDFVLPGSIVVRKMRCGKAACRCKADPPELHGPYIQWTRRVDGKTVTRFLSPDQLERYQPWFDNARRLRKLITELEALSVRAAEQAEGWHPQT
jgi:hypothetical protein